MSLSFESTSRSDRSNKNEKSEVWFTANNEQRESSSDSRHRELKQRKFAKFVSQYCVLDPLNIQVHATDYTSPFDAFQEIPSTARYAIKDFRAGLYSHDDIEGDNLHTLLARLRHPMVDVQLTNELEILKNCKRYFRAWPSH